MSEGGPICTRLTHVLVVVEIKTTNTTLSEQFQNLIEKS